EREREDRDGGEAGVLAEEPRAEAQIAEHRLEPAHPALVAHALLRLGDAAEAKPRLAPRVLEGHAAPQAVVDVELEVGVELLGEVALAGGGPQRPAQARQPSPGRAHAGSSSRPRKRARIAVAASQSAVSFSMRRRPARVSR